MPRASRSRGGSAPTSSAWASAWRPTSTSPSRPHCAKKLRPICPSRSNKYLADAHALEAQAIELLSRTEKIGGDPQLQAVYAEHLEESREHQRLVADRLTARGGKPTALKDAALRLGALNWGLFFQSQPDTPAKLAGFAYAFEHLEIAAYELLKRVAEPRRRSARPSISRHLGEQERAAASRIAGGFDAAVEASLRDLGVVVEPARRQRRRRRPPPLPRGVAGGSPNSHSRAIRCQLAVARSWPSTASVRPSMRRANIVSGGIVWRRISSQKRDCGPPTSIITWRT